MIAPLISSTGIVDASMSGIARSENNVIDGMFLRKYKTREAS